MNYCLAIAFTFVVLTHQELIPSVITLYEEETSLYYYNRNTGKIEYNSGSRYNGSYSEPNLYIKRYFVSIVLSNCAEALEHRIWLLLHSQQLGLTAARSICVRQRLIMCIFLDYLEAKPIYRTVLLYSIIILFNANYFTFYRCYKP